MAAETATNHYHIPTEEEQVRGNEGTGELIMAMRIQDPMRDNRSYHVTELEKTDGKSTIPTPPQAGMRSNGRHVEKLSLPFEAEAHDNSPLTMRKGDKIIKEAWKQQIDLYGAPVEGGTATRKVTQQTINLGRTWTVQEDCSAWLPDPTPKPPWPPPALGGRNLPQREECLEGGENFGTHNKRFLCLQDYVAGRFKPPVQYRTRNYNFDHHPSLGSYSTEVIQHSETFIGRSFGGEKRLIDKEGRNTNQSLLRIGQRQLSFGRLLAWVSIGGITGNQAVLVFRKGIGVRGVIQPPHGKPSGQMGVRLGRSGVARTPPGISFCFRDLPPTSQLRWLHPLDTICATMTSTPKKREYAATTAMDLTGESMAEGATAAEKETGTEEMMDVEVSKTNNSEEKDNAATPPLQKDYFWKSASALRTSKGKKGSTPSSGKKLSFAHATSAGKRNGAAFTPLHKRACEVSFNRVKFNSLLQDITRVLETTLNAMKSTVGPDNVALLPVKDDSGPPLISTPISKDEAFTTVLKYAASHSFDLDGTKSQKELEQSLQVLHEQLRGKSVQFTFVIIVGHNEMDAVTWGTIFHKLALANIRLSLKAHPAPLSKKNLVLFHAISKASQEYMDAKINQTLKDAIANSSEPFPEEPVLVISVGYPDQIYESGKSHLKNLSSKQVIKIEFDAKDEQLIKSVFRPWRSGLRNFMGIHTYPYLAPDMNDRNVPESKKTDFKGRAGLHSEYLDSTIHVSYRGFRPSPAGLDMSISFETLEGNGITTTARRIFMDVQLPSRTHRPRPLFLALLENSGGGVDAVIPNGEDYREAAKNIAVCPAGWFLYHLALEKDATMESLLAAAARVFDAEDIRTARNFVRFDDEGLLHLSFDMEEDNAANEEETEILELDWMQDAKAVSQQLNRNNARENGQLFDFDESSDVASVNTTAFNNRRHGRLFGEVMSARPTTAAAAASQASAADPHAPPREDQRVVGQGE